MTTLARELKKEEFLLAESAREHERQQKADPVADRKFGAFVHASGSPGAGTIPAAPGSKGSSRPGSSGAHRPYAQ